VSILISFVKISISLLKSDTVAVLVVLPWYPWYYHGNGYNFYDITAVLGWNTRDSCGDGDQSCGTTGPAVLPRLWRWVFLTYIKISRMRVQGRIYIISFTMRIVKFHLARQVVCASSPFGCSWFLVRSSFAYKYMLHCMYL